jgi:hypothetical protein
LITAEQYHQIAPFEYHVEAYVKDIKPAIIALGEAIVKNLTKWGQFRGVLSLMHLIQASPSSREVFRHRFQKFLSTDDILQNHLVCILLSQYLIYGIFQLSEAEEYLLRGFSMVDDFQRSWEYRYMIFDWMINFRELFQVITQTSIRSAPVSATLASGVLPSVSALTSINSPRYPLILDPLPIKEVKLCSLVRFLPKVSNSQVPMKEPANLSPKNYISALKCIKEYIFYPNTSPSVYSAFRVIAKYITYKDLFKDTANYLNTVIALSPSFTQNLITMIDYFFKQKKT